MPDELLEEALDDTVEEALAVLDADDEVEEEIPGGGSAAKMTLSIHAFA